MGPIRRMLRMAALMLALVFSAQAFGESDACVVQLDGAAFLLDADGKVLLASDDIESMFPVREGALYAAGRRGDYALYDASGKRLGELRFAMICDMGDALIYRQDGLYGAMDADGGVILTPQYSQLVSNGDGGFLATSGDADRRGLRKVLYVEPGSAARSTGVLASGELLPLRDGRMPYRGANGSYGCLDSRGRRVIPCKYDWIGAFDGGAAIAASNEQYGLMDVMGEWLLQPDYIWMRRGVNMVAAMTNDGRIDVVTPEGRRLYTIRTSALEASVVGNCVVVREENATSVYNIKGRCIYGTSRTIALVPGMDGQLIASEGPWGAEAEYLLNPDGTYVGPRRQHILPLCANRYAFCVMEGVEYYSDELHSLQTTWNYDGMRWGMMDGTGKMVLPPEYLEIRAVGENRLLLVRDEGAVFADVDGHPMWHWRGR